MHTSKFASFMTLEIVVCIGSDYIENVFRLVGLGCRQGPVNVDVCPDGGVWAVMAWDQERTKCQMVPLWSQSGDGTMVQLPWVC